MPRRQCKVCPWKVSTNRFEIPGGYDEAKHCALANTIATPGELPTRGILRIMACHETSQGKELPCVGWLDNQLNAGNNLMLRLAVRQKRISADYVLDGPQHPDFAATLGERNACTETNDS